MGSVPALGMQGFSCSTGLHVEEVCVGLVPTIIILTFVICPEQGILNFPSALGSTNYELHSGLGARVTKMKRHSLFLKFFIFVFEFCIYVHCTSVVLCTSSEHMMMKAYMEARRRYWMPPSWNCQQ